MKCPTCASSVLVMADRAGIEIDYCPECRGVWLDRGELDKIIERVTAEQMAARPAPPPPPPPTPQPAPYPAQGQAWPSSPQDPAYQPRRRDDDDDDDDDRRHYGDRPWSDNRYGKKKKKSLLGELFDF